MIFFRKNINKILTIILKSFFLIVIILIYFSSCKKKENASPEISVSKPINNQIFMIGDTIHISGHVSDDVLVNSVSVSIVDAKSISISSSENYSINNESADFSYDFIPIISEALSSESYSLKVSAYDGDLYTRVYIPIILSEKPLIKSGYLVLYRKNDYSTYLGFNDNALNEINKKTINDISKTITIDYNENLFYYYGISSGNLIALNSDDLIEKWQVSGINNFQPDYLSNMKVTNNLLFVSHQNARINAYDKFGNIRKSAQLNDLSYETGVFNVHNEFIVCFSSNNYQKRIECLNYETGSPMSYKVIDFDAVGIENYNNEKIVIFGNKNNITKACTLDVYQNIIYEITNFPQGKLQAVANISETETLLLIDSKVYLFNKTNVNISLFGIFANSQSISYDEISGELYIIANDKLQIYDFASSQLLNEKMFEDTVFGVVPVCGF
ncbi:MAG: hypothetical protein A2033_03125 [Bacteroidetes bacterium GWA2_31_9]|nr:MAG: hypothetical protein A2033_03125 [Bacteroidetes bacterium GWA2_31_9]